MSTSRIKASKKVLARIQAMSTKELTEVLIDKKSGTFAQTIREIAEFSGLEYDLNYHSQTQSSVEITNDLEFSHQEVLVTDDSWIIFEEVTTQEAANELIAA